MEARVERFDQHVEELVFLSVAEQTLVCFAGVCPHELEIGQNYRVILEIYVGGDYLVSEAGEEDKPGFERIGDSLAHWIHGVLSDGRFNVNGIEIQDDVLREEFGHLSDTFVKVRADRLDVEFV